MIKRILNTYSLPVFSIFVIYLWRMNDLNLLIHPRYHLFTISSAIFSLIVSSIVIYKRVKDNQSEITNGSLVLVTIIIVLISGLSPLSSAVLGQRNDQLNVVINSQSDISNNQIFENNFDSFSLADWNYYFSITNNLESINNQKVILEGFFYEDEFILDEYFQLSRFVISCCAVDARPVGILVQKSELSSEYGLDDWLKIEGWLEIRDIDSRDQVVIIVDELKSINAPDNPYIE